MTPKLLLAAILASALSAAAWAADAHFGMAAFSTETGTKAQDVFTPNAGKIMLHVQVADVAKGEKVSADWVAEKTEVAPPDYVIDSATVTLTGDDATEVTFSLTQPNAGWPVGAYRVDLAIDGQAKKSVTFTVAP